MNMYIGISVCRLDFVVIYFGKPVVCRDGSGVVEDKSAYRIGNGGILFNTPVLLLDVFVHCLLVIKDRGFHVTDLFTILSVKDVSLCNVGITCLFKDMLRAVLDLLDVDRPVFDLGLEIACHPECQQIDDVIVVIFLRGRERL